MASNLNCAAENNLEFPILLSLPYKCWRYRFVPPCLILIHSYENNIGLSLKFIIV